MAWEEHPKAGELKGIRERLDDPMGTARFEQPLSDDDLKVMAGAAIRLSRFAKEIERERNDSMALLDEIDVTRMELRERLGLSIRKNREPEGMGVE